MRPRSSRLMVDGERVLPVRLIVKFEQNIVLHLAVCSSLTGGQGKLQRSPLGGWPIIIIITLTISNAP